jgi:pimeloyl-ACP methyl ester carboxylesterase
MTPKPSVILLPGAWHLPIIYSAVESLLDKAGYTDVCSIALPSSGNGELPLTRDPDIAAVRSAINPRLQDGKDIILVAHSYSGSPASEALEGLPSAQTPTSGSSGRILGIVYLAAMIYPLGQPQPQPFPVDSFPPFSLAEPPHVRFAPHLDAATIKDLFYNDLDSSAAQAWYEKLAPQHSFGCATEPVRYVPWTGDFRCVYVVCTDDRTLPEAFQMGMIGAEGAKFEFVKCKSGHSAMLSRPEFVVQVIDVVEQGTELVIEG